jgi:hypothetical protein
MYNGVGLLTAKGSATSGHVQTNLARVRPRDSAVSQRARNDASEWEAQKQTTRSKVVDQGLKEHDAKIAIEAVLFDMRESMEDEGIAQDVIESRIMTERQRLLLDYLSRKQSESS